LTDSQHALATGSTLSRRRAWFRLPPHPLNHHHLLSPAPCPHTQQQPSQSQNWDGDYGYKISGTTSVNAPIVGSLATSMPGYPQFTTAGGGFRVAPARPIPPTFFPGLYGTFSPVSLLGRRRKLMSALFGQGNE
jgi:hypothetical protein